MRFSQSFKLAFKSIMASKVRSLLTMLGIIIGVGAVIVIVGLGDGMQNYMQSAFSDLGTNTVTAYIYGSSSTRAVGADDMFELVRDNSEYIDGVSPSVSMAGTVQIDGETIDNTSMLGVAETYDNMSNLDLTAGRFLEYMDMKSNMRVCVIGSYINENYFDSNGIGKVIKIAGNPYYIVGTLEMKADNEEGGDDSKIYIPYTTAMKAGYQSQINQYIFAVNDSDNVDVAKSIISTKLYNIVQDEDAYTLMSMAELLDSMNQIINVLVTVLASIAAISLFVGGIGIMNIMLVSVSERTREIGIRKALGATNGNILTQFVIEAGTTSAMGGLLGIGLGYLLSTIATVIIKVALDVDIAVTPSLNAVFIAFGISFAIGVIFGFLPARKAAKLNPIDALRYE